MADPRELTAESAITFLEGQLAVSPSVRVRLLAGGVSNTAVLGEAGEHGIVLEQALPRLRVRAEWRAGRARVLREWAVIEALGAALPGATARAAVSCDAPQFLVRHARRAG